MNCENFKNCWSRSIWPNLSWPMVIFSHALHHGLIYLLAIKDPCHFWPCTIMTNWSVWMLASEPQTQTMMDSAILMVAICSCLHVVKAYFFFIGSCRQWLGCSVHLFWAFVFNVGNFNGLNGKMIWRGFHWIIYLDINGWLWQVLGDTTCSPQ